MSFVRHPQWLVSLCFLWMCVSVPCAAAQEALSALVDQPFSLLVESPVQDGLRSWVLSRNGETIEAVSTPIYTTTFVESGMYDLTLSIRDRSGRTEEHRFSIIVSPNLNAVPNPSGALRAVLESDPPADRVRNVRIPADGGSLQFTAQNSVGSITRYTIDLNAEEDSDGDGILDNDADNSYDPSFTTGAPWTISIRPAPNEQQRRVQLTVEDVNGQKSSDTLTITFDPTLTLTPRLRTFPRADATDRITLNAAGGLVTFNAQDSFGGVRSFALDLDTTADADGDGIPDNDNDVSQTSFAQDGSDVSVLLRPLTGETRSIQLTVFDAANLPASLPLTVVFPGAIPLQLDPSPSPDAPQGDPIILTDPTPIVTDDTFTLTVQSPPPGITAYSWDIRSSGVEDKRTEQPSITLKATKSGDLPVSVDLLDPLGSVYDTLDATFVVYDPDDVPTQGDPTPDSSNQDTASSSDDSAEGGMRIVSGDPTADLAIAASVQGLISRFEPRPGIPLNLLRLQPEWDFGDGTRSFLLHPVHEYVAAGTYTVSLVLRDLATDEEVATAQASVIATVVTSPPNDDTDSFAWFGTMMSVASWILTTLIILFVLALIITGISYLVRFLRKALSERTTDRVTQDIIADQQDAIAAVVDRPSAPDLEAGKAVESPVELMPTDANVVDVPSISDDGPAPPWLQSADTPTEPISTVASEPLAEPTPPETEPVPEWLKADNVSTEPPIDVNNQQPTINNQQSTSNNSQLTNDDSQTTEQSTADFPDSPPPSPPNPAPSNDAAAVPPWLQQGLASASTDVAEESASSTVNNSQLTDNDSQSTVDNQPEPVAENIETEQIPNDLDVPSVVSADAGNDEQESDEDEEIDRALVDEHGMEKPGWLESAMMGSRSLDEASAVEGVPESKKKEIDEVPEPDASIAELQNESGGDEEPLAYVKFDDVEALQHSPDTMESEKQSRINKDDNEKPQNEHDNNANV